MPPEAEWSQIICNENTLNQANKADALSALLIILTLALDISLLRDMSAGKLPKVLTSHCLGVRAGWGGGIGLAFQQGHMTNPKREKEH